MGGCKCTFADCGVSTTTAKKMFQGRETHFFHFPIRDAERCIQWAIFSNNMIFLELPLEKIKNKVICDLHFNENNFMNYKREKLNKTNAIPTIYIHPEDKKEIDLLKSPMKWVEMNKKKPVPTTFSKHTKIDMDDSSFSMDSFQAAEEPSSTVKRKAEPIITYGPPKVKILNISATPNETSPARTVKKLPTIPQKTQVIKVSGESYTIRRVPKVVNSAPVITKQEIIQAALPQIDFFDVNDLQFAAAELPAQQAPETVQPPPADDLKPILLDSLKQIAEIKEILVEQQKLEQPKLTIKKEISTLTQSHLNKVQLFNGIKRYLSPSMNALLRIELFSSANREYKKDEKIICQEILALGDKTYDFLSDEWRLRLPAKQEVQTWKDEQLTEDDDAS